MRGKRFFSAVVAAGALALAAGCAKNEMPKHLQPLSYALQEELKSKSLSADAPIMLRIFKEDSELEIWKRGPSGVFSLVTTYDICTWSGELGPKVKEGDKQAPEGVYTVRPAQMNPLSKYYLSFNLGYPNTFDRVHGRTGAHLMVHGACSSAGCYSMTDDYIRDIYALAREAFDGGQQEFQVQAYPFRMTDENMARHKDHEWYGFWVNLKEGYDAFEAERIPPKVDVCGGRYVFNAVFTVPDDRVNATAQCPPYVKSTAAAIAADRDSISALIEGASAPVQILQQQQSTQ